MKEKSGEAACQLSIAALYTIFGRLFGRLFSCDVIKSLKSRFRLKIIWLMLIVLDVINMFRYIILSWVTQFKLQFLLILLMTLEYEPL